VCGGSWRVELRVISPSRVKAERFPRSQHVHELRRDRCAGFDDPHECQCPLKGGPIGATENSPAFERWVNAFEIFPSPVGTTEPHEITGTTARGFFRPYGTRFDLPPIPTVETVGYCRVSLRDWGGVNAALRWRKEARA